MSHTLYLTCTSIEVLKVYIGFNLILRYIIQSVNENAGIKIVQDGLHFSASPVPHLRSLEAVRDQMVNPDM